MISVDRHLAIWAGWISAPAAGIAMMAAPEYLKFNAELVAYLFWGGTAVFLLSVVVVLILLLREPTEERRVAPDILIGLGIVVLAAGLIWKFWPKEKISAPVLLAPTSSNESKLEIPDKAFLLSRFTTRTILNKDGRVSSYQVFPSVKNNSGSLVEYKINYSIFKVGKFSLNDLTSDKAGYINPGDEVRFNFWDIGSHVAGRDFPQSGSFYYDISYWAIPPTVIRNVKHNTRFTIDLKLGQLVIIEDILHDDSIEV